VNAWIRARILRIEDDEKKVGLTMRGVEQPTSDELAELDAASKAGQDAGAESAGAESTEVREAAVSIEPGELEPGAPENPADADETEDPEAGDVEAEPAS
jgi:hypothetical protein